MYPFVRALDYVQLAGANQGHAIDQRPFCFFQSIRHRRRGTDPNGTALVEAGLKSGQLVTVLDDFAPPPVDGFFLFYPSRRQIRPRLRGLHRSSLAVTQHRDGITMSTAPIPS